MFYYFGRKARLAKANCYPAPEHDLVIEPFAGSMAYTLRYKPKCAIGIEIDPLVVEAWNSIRKLTKEQILAKENYALGSRVEDRWAMMAGGSHGTTTAKSYKWTERMARDFDKQKRMAAKFVDYANASIEYRLGSYETAPDVEATWFIDPPYRKILRGYRREGLDYTKLAEWCRSRKGLVIVCEQQGADWLPFEETVAEIKGTNNKKSSEVFWTNKPNAFRAGNKRIFPIQHVIEEVSLEKAKEELASAILPFEKQISDLKENIKRKQAEIRADRDTLAKLRATLKSIAAQHCI